MQWGDCDPAGIVWYPRYFEWFDASTAALFAAAGVSNSIMHKTWRIVGIPMVDTRAKFFIPSKFEDEITIESTVVEFRRSSFDVHHRILKQGRLAVEGFETRVWTVRDANDPERLESAPIPAEVIAQFQERGAEIAG
ncbi:MAG TPA: thioesterase family protein [Bryobacteraceae bacterium]